MPKGRAADCAKAIIVALSPVLFAAGIFLRGLPCLWLAGIYFFSLLP